MELFCLHYGYITREQVRGAAPAPCKATFLEDLFSKAASLQRQCKRRSAVTPGSAGGFQPCHEEANSKQHLEKADGKLIKNYSVTSWIKEAEFAVNLCLRESWSPLSHLKTYSHNLVKNLIRNGRVIKIRRDLDWQPLVLQPAQSRAGLDAR